MTDAAGNITATYDYYPYGGTRIEEYFGEEQGTNRRFTGHELDEETDLTYAGARYYAAGVGRFTQQDSLLNNLSDSQVLKDNFDRELNQILSNPQQLNAYAYALNNPIIYIDPDGNAQDPFNGYKEAVGKLADWMADKIDSYLANQQKQLQETQNHFATQFDSLSDKQKEFYGNGEKYGDSMALLQESMYAVMGMMGGKGSNGKAFNSLDDVFAEAAKHAKEMGTHKKNKINLCQSIRVQLEL